jgi:Squalene-hopene cyclase C-terminal domain
MIVDDRHVRAVIRTALRAYGFDPQIGDLIASDRRRTVLGLKLRDLLLTNLPAFATQADILRIAYEDSSLWNRLPSMLAFGHEQAAVFHHLMHPDQRSQRPASLMPVSTFSAGISLLDHLADALWYAEPIFEILDKATVANLFTNGRDAEAKLRQAYEDAEDVRLRLLFALVAMCAAGIRALHRQSGDDRVWHDLLETFSMLHAAQRAVSFHDASCADAPPGVDAIATKSVLPFVAAHQIVELFDGPAVAKRSGRELARQMGQAVALTDDLVDLLSDWRSGAPNTITRRAGVEAGNSYGYLTDVQLYRLVEDAASEVVSTLRSASLLYTRRPPAARSTAIEAAARFATLTIARWVGWHEELSRPSVFSFRRPRPMQALLGPCADAASMLLEQQRTGYQEAIHWMTVPRLDEDDVRLAMYPAILFQRAVVLDGLLDAYAAGLDIPVTVLAQEALLLLKSKREDVRGGWSYLSDVPELPPDVDDLAMMLQVISRCGGQPLAAACHQALELVLATADRGDAITTWILEPDEELPGNEMFRRYIKLTQAEGVHPEVIANLLFAVSLYSINKGRDGVANGIAYLECAQSDDGSWYSRWYSGRHYGTYRAVLALTSLAPESRALDRAHDYLLSMRNADGGWGTEGLSDPLGTAFAALSLAALARPGSSRFIRSALEYLVSTQLSDGGWPGCPFIAFPRVGAPGVHVYSSSTITTSFCLKAILAGRRAYSSGRVAKLRTRSTSLSYRPRPTAADWS